MAVGATGWVAKEVELAIEPLLGVRTKAFKRAFAITSNAGSDIASIADAILVMVNEYANL